MHSGCTCGCSFSTVVCVASLLVEVHMHSGCACGCSFSTLVGCVVSLLVGVHSGCACGCSFSALVGCVASLLVEGRRVCVCACNLLAGFCLGCVRDGVVCVIERSADASVTYSFVS